MAVTSGFFDSVDGDRRYDAEQMTNYFEGIVSDGIYENIGEAFIVKAVDDGLKISVGSGRALCKTHWIKNDAPITFTLSPANVQYPRADAVFIRYDANSRTVDIVIEEGTPGPYPYIPMPTRTDEVWDLYLASIRVDKNATRISQANIFDYRASEYCGWVTGVITQVDTSELFLQWQTAYENYYAASTAAFDAYMSAKRAEFDQWYRTLTGELRVDTSIHKYQGRRTITASDNKYNIEMPDIPNLTNFQEQYEWSYNDIFIVTVNGVVFPEKNAATDEGDVLVDITDTQTRRVILRFDRALKAGDVVNLLVLKSVVGDGDVANIPVNSQGRGLLAAPFVIGDAQIIDLEG